MRDEVATVEQAAHANEVGVGCETDGIAHSFAGKRKQMYKLRVQCIYVFSEV